MRTVSRACESQHRNTDRLEAGGSLLHQECHLQAWPRPRAKSCLGPTPARSPGDQATSPYRLGIKTCHHLLTCHFRSKTRSHPRVWHTRASLLSVWRPHQGPGLTGHLPLGHRSSSGPSHCSQGLTPATGLCWVIQAGSGAGVPALKLPEAQPGPRLRRGTVASSES